MDPITANAALSIATSDTGQSLIFYAIIFCIVCCCLSMSSASSGLAGGCFYQLDWLTKINFKTIVTDASIICCGLIIPPFLPVSVIIVCIRCIIAGEGTCKFKKKNKK